MRQIRQYVFAKFAHWTVWGTGLSYWNIFVSLTNCTLRTAFSRWANYTVKGKMTQNFICDNVSASASLRHFFNFSVIALIVDEMVFRRRRNGAMTQLVTQVPRTGCLLSPPTPPFTFCLGNSRKKYARSSYLLSLFHDSYVLLRRWIYLFLSPVA